ncbi:hypothetical protein C0992_005657, partial [Termitomyces sp. T32_za158]
RITNVVMSRSPAQFSSLWALDDGVTKVVSTEGNPYKYDFSMPLNGFRDVVDKTREHLRSKGLGDLVIGYAHAGDGKPHPPACPSSRSALTTVQSEKSERISRQPAPQRCCRGVSAGNSSRIREL